tara:strand:+ start:1363 stop:1803 length:441 start_codon:yes stop_codon:yes gene_type:complete
MIIFENENEANAVRGILEYVATETNYYWRDDSEVEHDKPRYSEYMDLRKRLISGGYISEEFDLAQVLYKFLDLYPSSAQSTEDTRQYMSVVTKLTDKNLNRLSDRLYKLTEKRTKKVDRSTQFDVALDILEKQLAYESLEEVDDVE